MADFLTAYTKTAAVEGGYANDPHDTGGETWRGISRKNNPQWLGWVIVDNLRRQPGFPASLAKSPELQQHVLRLYKLVYWDVNRLGEIQNQALADELYDTGVNAGTRTAALILQRALNLTNRNQADYPDLTRDGKIGPQTLAAVNKHPRPALLLKALNLLQGIKYVEIAEANATQEKFIGSWFSRVSLA